MAAILILGVAVSCSHSESTIKKENKANNTDQEIRVVSLFNTATEILHGLGKVDKLVGVDVTSKFPEQVKELPSLGHYPNFNVEGIISLEPTVVLARRSEVKPDLKAQLEQVGVRIKLFDQEFSKEGTGKLIAEIGKEFRSSQIQASLDKLNADLRQAEYPEKPVKLLFIYSRGTGSLMVAGANTQIDGLFKLAKVQNAAKGFEGYKPIGEEGLVEANPDAIVVFKSAMPFLDGGQTLWNVNGIENTKAGRYKALIVLDEMKASSFGPRLGEAVQELCKSVRQLGEK